MIRNYFTIALRNIRQNPLYSLINIFSLAIGLASCIVIYLFISDEKSFDSFHTKKNSIYRVDETQNFAGTNFQKVALTGGPFGPAMMEEFPEVANYTRFWGGSKRLLQSDDKQFLVDGVATVDSSFLNIFDFELLYGDRSTVLDEPNTMVLTEKTARKFFDHIEDALGKMIKKRDREYKVTGIMKDVPENSHLQFEVLESMATYIKEDSTINTDWGGNFLYTYLVLHNNVDVEAMQAKFPDWLIRWTGDKDVGKRYTIYLQPFLEVHLDSNDIEHDYSNYRKFNGSYLDVFTLVGIFIMLIAAVNFMNLTTARASHRWKEIGVRTSVGARKKQLFSQFIFESLMLALFSLVLAVLLDIIFIPSLNLVIGRQLLLSSVLAHPTQILILVAVALGLGFLTGIYPSFYMTSFNPSSVLKGVMKTGGKSIFRSTLVVVQFGLAMAMIVSTLIVLQQLYYMRNKDIGFNKDQILLVDLKSKEIGPKFPTLKTEILRNSYVKGVTASGQRIGNNFHQSGFKIKSDTGVVNFGLSNVNVDYDYLKVYGMQIKEGRDFTPADESKGFIVNESLVKEMGLKNPIGMQAGHGWSHNDSLGSIIGVVKDFNFNSLHHKINNLIISYHSQWSWDEMSIKVDGAHAKEVIEYVNGVWDKNITTFPFTYYFLDDHFNNLYRSDTQMSSVVSIMAVLAILISCMGLFGLAVITTERKIKEIGIRKALGATEMEITVLLSKDFARLILIAFVLASPVTYFTLSGWLDNFAFRIGINPLIFVLGGMLALIIALLTISYHTIRSARQNPVKALRYE